ncbi:TadE/TadG family type IV pilus assembly protein [Marinomonas lutimaris]|uniref:TadE/TadG family type IV pilus assembly protein n=1 Tax=Marinomonas lutimaris TaxID=2846746 RepID=UPI001CA4DE54|nr:pilus assembly protein [Marinomonas lutimaris]
MIVIDSIRFFIRKEKAVVSIEVALIFPVILFIAMMFFELARIALIISVVGVSLERTTQEFRYNKDFISIGEEGIKQTVSDKVVENSYGLIYENNIKVDLQSFSDLNDFASVDIESGSYRSLPILNFSVLLNDNFITPLPGFFGLGNSFQHEYRQVLGDLVGKSSS